MSCFPNYNFLQQQNIPYTLSIMQPTPRVEHRHHRGHGFTPYGRRNPWLPSMQPAPRVSLPDDSGIFQ